MSRNEATAAMHNLAGILNAQGKSDMASRLHRRAELIDQTTILEKTSRASNGTSGSVSAGFLKSDSDDVEQREGVKSLCSLADQHCTRGNYQDACRVMLRVMELEEKKHGRASSKQYPVLVQYANILEKAGSMHEAEIIRQRAADLIGMNFA